MSESKKLSPHTAEAALPPATGSAVVRKRLERRAKRLLNDLWMADLVISYVCGGSFTKAVLHHKGDDIEQSTHSDKRFTDLGTDAVGGQWVP